VYTSRGVITESLNYNVKVFNNENNYKPNNKRTNIEIVNNIYDYVEENELKILKIIICDESKIIFNNIIGKLKNIKGVEVLDVEHMSKKIIKTGTEEYKIEYFYTEVTNKNANKWNAILYLADKLKIKDSEIICMGDNINDFEMIKNSGLGIVMRNSALEKQKIADYVSSSSLSSSSSSSLSSSSSSSLSSSSSSSLSSLSSSSSSSFANSSEELFNECLESNGWY
jgi:hydroxymethylpyrimidine pyrophosphatase-like HAD family hydrolase